MTSTFLHKDKKVPPDETEERDAPSCPNCGQQMWVIRVETQLSDKGTRSMRYYECSRCGATQTLRTKSELITPISPDPHES
jgi:DNA-directed RNA polymerase subunit M/transcription elongation factor TFIIS